MDIHKVPGHVALEHAANAVVDLGHRATHIHLRKPAQLHISRQSRYGLYFSNFLLAELVGVLLPLLSEYLLESGWRVDDIGFATAVAGLGLLIAQCPAGVYLDRMHHYRRMLIGSALVVGLCFGSLPFLLKHPIALELLLFISGVGQAFIMPLLGTLSLAMAGHSGINKLMGISQTWNHAGNIGASAAVMWLVNDFGTPAAFYSIAFISVGAALSTLIIRQDELHENLPLHHKATWGELLHDSRVRRLIICSLFFHLANAAVTPLVAMYANTLGAADGFITFLVFGAQAAMVAAAYGAARMGDQLGRKPVMAVAFIILPVRIILYALCDAYTSFLWIALLDGLSVGIYSVVIASTCADIDDDRGRFNTLLSLAFVTLALGSVVSPYVGGIVVQHYGYKAAFYMFAAIAAVGAVLFLLLMPETQAPETNSEKADGKVA